MATHEEVASQDVQTDSVWPIFNRSFQPNPVVPMLRPIIRRTSFVPTDSIFSMDGSMDANFGSTDESDYVNTFNSADGNRSPLSNESNTPDDSSEQLFVLAPNDPNTCSSNVSSRVDTINSAGGNSSPFSNEPHTSNVSSEQLVASSSNETGSKSPQIDAESQDSSDESDIYEVERVLGKRIVRKKVNYSQNESISASY